MANLVSCGLKCNEEKARKSKLILTKFNFTDIIGLAYGSVIFLNFFKFFFFTVPLMRLRTSPIEQVLVRT